MDTGRQQPVDQQPDAVQCHKCGSKGEFAVHKCKTVKPSTQLEPVAEQSVICFDCDRSFRWAGDLKWYKCLPERKSYF